MHQLDTADNLYITIINPARYPADGNQCECFKTAVKVHVAWGLKQLLNRIPYEDAVSIRIQMVGIMISAAIFGLVHANVAQFVNALLLGLLLGLSLIHIFTKLTSKSWS